MMATSKTRLRTRSRLPSVERLEARRLMAVGFDQVALPAGDVATGLLTTAGDGSVWMTAEAGTGSTAQPEILRLDPATGLTTVAASLPAGTDPIGLTKGPDGSIWMISARADGTGLVTDFGPNGTLTEGLPDAPTSFAFGADGDLYATAQHTNADGSQNGEILRLDPATIRVTTFTLTDSGKSLGSMTLGPDGNVWFAEQDAEEFGHIAPDGTIATMALPSQVGSGVLAPGAASYVLFARTSLGLVYGIGADGTAALLSDMTDLDPQEYVAGANGSVWFTSWGVQSGIGKLDTSGNTQAYGGNVNIYDGGLPDVTHSYSFNGEYPNSPAGLTSDNQGGCWYTIQNGTALCMRVRPLYCPSRPTFMTAWMGTLYDMETRVRWPRTPQPTRTQ